MSFTIGCFIQWRPSALSPSYLGRIFIIEKHPGVLKLNLDIVNTTNHTCTVDMNRLDSQRAGTNSTSSPVLCCSGLDLSTSPPSVDVFGRYTLLERFHCVHTNAADGLLQCSLVHLIQMREGVCLGPRQRYLMSRPHRVAVFPSLPTHEGLENRFRKKSRLMVPDIMSIWKQYVC